MSGGHLQLAVEAVWSELVSANSLISAFLQGIPSILCTRAQLHPQKTPRDRTFFEENSLPRRTGNSISHQLTDLDTISDRSGAMSDWSE